MSNTFFADNEINTIKLEKKTTTFSDCFRASTIDILGSTDEVLSSSPLAQISFVILGVVSFGIVPVVATAFALFAIFANAMYNYCESNYKDNDSYEELSHFIGNQ